MNKKQKLLLWLLIIILVPILAVISGTFLFWVQLSPVDKNFVSILIEHHKIYIFSSFTLFILIVGYIAQWMFLKYFIPLQKLVEDAEILNNAERLYLIETKGGKELKNLAHFLNRHAYQVKDLKNDIDKKIKQSKNALEEEKNILASLVSELSEGIIICNNEGQIVLVNNCARDLFSEHDKSSDVFKNLVGIGRSIYKIIPREIIAHAREEINHKLSSNKDNVYAQLVYSLPATTTVRIRMVPVLKAGISLGFILIIYDITRKLDKDLKRYDMMDSIIHTTRSSLANMRAAIEAITEYKDMSWEQREKFQNVIADEAARMTTHMNSTETQYKDYFTVDWPLEQIQGLSLLQSLQRNAADKNLELVVKQCEDSIWLSIENFSFINMILFLFQNIRSTKDVSVFALELNAENGFVYLDIFWQGATLDDQQFSDWISQPLRIDQAIMPFTSNDVIKRHNARIWQINNPDSKNNMRILLKAPEAVLTNRSSKNNSWTERPEFYDFDLFAHRALFDKLEKRPLSKLKFVVFDVETTGLNPSDGDEIISLGAVRIVNGKILLEQYEQLIDPRRKISPVTTRITNISTEMVADKPTIDQVLPSFHSYCEDAVLVAHNAAFDMRFLQLKEEKLGLVFDNPVLDTLLLSASVHTTQDSHSLDAIADRFGLTINGRHTALGDARVTAEILLKLLPILADKGIKTLEQALKVSQKTYYARLKY